MATTIAPALVQRGSFETSSASVNVVVSFGTIAILQANNRRCQLPRPDAQAQPRANCGGASSFKRCWKKACLRTDPYGAKMWKSCGVGADPTPQPVSYQGLRRPKRGIQDPRAGCSTAFRGRSLMAART